MLTSELISESRQANQNCHITAQEEVGVRQFGISSSVKLHIHSCFIHQIPEDGGVDGQRGDGHPEGVRLQGLHLRRVQEGERQLPRKTVLEPELNI